MSIETLGEAFKAGWRITVRCAWGKREGLKSIRECRHTYELDMQTLIWTRGADLPLSLLEDRLRCPRCRSLRVRLLYRVPPDAERASVG
jgi:hypothetical protein